VSERDDVNHIFMFDFGANAETQLTNTAKGDDAPKFSPNGEMLAFVRDDKSVVVMDMASKAEKGGRHGLHQRLAAQSRVVGGQQVGRVSRPEYAIVQKRVSRAGGRR
jgi:Tol biopolymer transport system component